MTTAPSPSVQDRDVILAVDDNEQNLQLIEEYLWQWGYDVVLAHDGLEALQLFPQHNPSLILLDVMMPRMDGYEACARIKATPQGRRIPIVMLTALRGTEDKIRALEHGADDFLNKPISRQELQSRIRSLIRIRNLRKELDSSENIIVTLSAALERKHPRSGGHAQRVASYAALLAERLGMSSEDREIIIKGALLHDIGLIGVPDEILQKEEKDLSPEEARRFAEHASMGTTILRPMRTFQQFLPIVRWHHERWDGTGYPDGLAGDQIPIEAQIAAIANRFDEIRHLGTMPSQQGALEILESEARGGAFNPALVGILIRALREEPAEPLKQPVSIRKPVPHPTVLCVDDNAQNRELITAMVEEAGFRILEAENGEQAIGRLHEKKVDLVLMDLNMPVQGGRETVRQIRESADLEFLPVIVITAERSDELRKDAILSGADDFLTHPVNRLELITRIRSLLRITDYHSDLERTYDVICALALAIEAKDEYTRGHSQRVADLAYRFSLHLGLETAEAERIRLAGLLHDIGKIAVPESLLNKPGPLSRDEFLRVIDHPVIGEEICRPLTTLSAVLQLIRHHHERYDGRGYPDGLKGTDIPQSVRLLSVVDAYDALTSNRAYRPSPLSHTAALETLSREADAGKWDPQIVLALHGMLGETPPDFSHPTLPIP
ncbi:MAG TPA: HD domain-containing phosphohydrolase, partial [Thermoanaerobaculia bacterium]|nr:HD domain-containing phosphohydrolase [Thermoanaerobaculia bacterium]